MKVCFPTVDESGTGARLSPHFGRAPFFTLVETESRAVETRPNGNLRREHGLCNPLFSLEDAGVEAVVCRQLGRNALAEWVERGVPVYRTDAVEVEVGLDGLLAGELERLG